MQTEQEVNILLVDDHPENLLALEAILEKLKLNLVKAHSGEQALKYLLKQDFALILLDVQMPGIDGFETAKLIRERERSQHIPIIFLTAFSKVNTLVFQGYSLGAVDYLFKPIEPEILSSKVAVFVEMWQKTAEIKRQAALLTTFNNELEMMVQKRTKELTLINTSLQVEITERKRVEEQLKVSLQEKEVLLKEIHHRVKNNLQIISSLLNLQLDYIEEPEYLEIFKVSQNRIDSMALIHEKLYQSQNLAKINLADYIQDLAANLFDTYSTNLEQINFQLKVEDISLEVDRAIPCGLIINELVSNCLKYAFPTDKKGEVCLTLYRDYHNQINLSISDNGIGFPKELDFQATSSLGLQLVNTLVNQLEGNIKLNNVVGTEFIITFPNQLELLQSK